MLKVESCEGEIDSIHLLKEQFSVADINIGSHHLILVQLSFKGFVCMIEKVSVHTIQFGIQLLGDELKHRTRKIEHLFSTNTQKCRKDVKKSASTHPIIV